MPTVAPTTQHSYTLTIRKCPYSRSPWRIGVLSPEGRFTEISYFWFTRKRDALPFLADLQAIPDADWSIHPGAWTGEAAAQARGILERSPGWVGEHGLRTRGLVAPGGA